VNPVGFGCFYFSLGSKAKINFVGLSNLVEHFSAVGKELFTDRGHESHFVSI
jgi:hypothetical protein